MRASRAKKGKFPDPVYGRPSDLVMVDLGLYTKERTASARGAGWMRRRARPVSDAQGDPHGRARRQGAADHVGSTIPSTCCSRRSRLAKAILEDGTVVWLEFAGKNGRAYRGVGAVLKALGAFHAPYNGTMQGIRHWFADNPTRFDEVADQSESYVFSRSRSCPAPSARRKSS